MRFIETLIQEATKCNKDEIFKIEMFMRDSIFKSTLDWQTKAQLIKAAKEAKECLDFMNTADGKIYLSDLRSQIMR